MQQPECVVVFAGGPRPSARVRELLPPQARIVAADRGAEHALALGLAVELAVGDFDSLGARTLAALERAGTRIERHPVAKAASDLELALDAAAALGPRRVLVVGAATGRLDHLLAALLLLGAEAYAGFELDALLGRARVHVIRGTRALTGEVRERISLFALHGPAGGVSSEGLAYPLHDEALVPGSSRGLSNLFLETHARLRVGAGVVIAVRPGGRASAGELTSARRGAVEAPRSA